MAYICKECGVPRIIGKTHVWRDGCIVDKASGRANLCIYEASCHNALAEGMGEALGIPLDNIIFNAGKHASMEVVSDMISAHPYLARIAYAYPVYHLTERLSIHLGKAIGIGRPEIIELKKEGLKIHYHEPYHLAHCMAIIVGGSQPIYDLPLTYEATDEGDYILVDIIPTPEGTSDEEAFLRLASDELVPGNEEAS